MIFARDIISHTLLESRFLSHFACKGNGLFYSINYHILIRNYLGLRNYMSRDLEVGYEVISTDIGKKLQ